MCRFLHRVQVFRVRGSLYDTSRTPKFLCPFKTRRAFSKSTESFLDTGLFQPTMGRNSLFLCIASCLFSTHYCTRMCIVYTLSRFVFVGFTHIVQVLLILQIKFSSWSLKTRVLQNLCSNRKANVSSYCILQVVENKLPC